jgi:hypothetical protein
MQGFIIRTKNIPQIRFQYYAGEAPVTVAAFQNCLPFSKVFFHARVSGQEIWTDKGLGLDINQENASVFTMPGEAVLGPLKPERVKARDAIGIYYGEGRGLDASNIFARVHEEDLPLLAQLGLDIWKHGEQEIWFEALS